ncbi:major surface-labeled trophozoite antigen 417-like [Malaya genurostris]|uniref:major surface-labeled trophozoite antigen 417-like n=1 Tax=Malaya genurostris TaxID=325434 RepID=UPI0026F3A99F|nr:major surface-labeled trophozoite antigen 417-like [Malaya genurostris]
MIRNGFLLVISAGICCLNTVQALYCYNCVDNQCIDGATIANVIQCSTTASNDQCYTKYSGYKIVQRGCMSAMTPTDQSSCSASADCELCSGDRCNQYSRATHTCIKCSSANDENCFNPSASMQAERCGAPSTDVSQVQCYTRVIGTVTERGCIQSQNDIDGCDRYQCATCFGSGCNGGEYPAGRQKCIKCSGTACATATFKNYCALPGDNCAMIKNGDGTISKNCESSLSDTEKSYCQANPAKCFYCGNNGCNECTIDIQANPKCYTCEGTNCLRSTLELETCHNVDDSCFTIFDGYNPVRRGCKSALTIQQKAACEDADDVSCDLCTTNACNLLGRKDHNCEYCSSTVSDICVANPNNPIRCAAPITEVTAEGQCYTRIIGSVTERGCLGSSVDAMECKSADNCQMCAIQNGSPCNKVVFPTGRRKCMVGSTADQYCPDPNDSCVQMMQNTVRSKKCKSSMSEEEVAFCQTNSNKCHFCTSDNCNAQDKTFDYIECLSCSSDSDPSCTSDPGAISTIQQCQTCVAVYSKSTTILRRSCFTSLTPAEQQQCQAGTDLLCSSCTTNRCNREIHPTGRLACYSCQGDSCFSHDSIKLEYCPIYQQDDSCFVQLGDSGQLVRLGCKSSLSSAEVASCSAGSAVCKTCATSGCNEPARHLLSSSCIQCTSANDPDCIDKASKYDAEPCNDPLNTVCYTRLILGSSVERGCVNDLDSPSKDQCAKGYQCNLCGSPTGKCNSLLYPGNWLSCYQCESSQNDTSCKNAQAGTPSVCPMYHKDNKCYTIVQANGQTTRKCSTQARDVQCAGSAQCEVCLFNGCNNRVSTSITSTNETGTTAAPATTTQKPGSADRVVGVGFATILLLVITFALRLPSV